MDDVIIITEILKYFNFEELCIAERINPNFKSCVNWELHRLKCFDSDQMFTVSWTKLMAKIQAYCSGLLRLKNLHKVLTFMLRKKLDPFPPDPFIFEDLKKHLLILLPSLEKLTCLEIDSNFIEIFGWKCTLSFVENARNLKQLSATIGGMVKVKNQVRDKIIQVIIGHSALTKLKIYGDLWIDLSSCRNLTDFTLTSYRTMDSADYEQLYALLDINLNLESLDIATVSHKNLQLIEKLIRLPKLKSLSLQIPQFHYTQLDEDLLYQRIMKDLYFVSLQNIEVCCNDSESHAKFVAFLLSRSPLLKELSLLVIPGTLAFYRIIFDKFPLYNQMKIFRLLHSPETDEVQSFIHKEISKMVNLKHFWINYNGFYSDHIEKISELRKLKFLRWPAYRAAALKIMSSNSSLLGLDLYANQCPSPGSFDLILDQCPNLRYFSVNILNAEQIRKLPLKAPNLQYFLIRMLDYCDLSPIKDALIYALQNLPNLRQLFIPAMLYNSLLGLEPVKRLSRQKRLSIIAHDLCYCDSSDDLINGWIHLCCQENPST